MHLRMRTLYDAFLVPTIIPVNVTTLVIESERFTSEETKKMENSSSEGSADEEEIIRNFDKEAQIIVQSETLPKKSSDRYLLVYNTYKKWREENKHLLSSSEESNLIVYFESLKKKLKPPTLWSVWSMLKTTLNVNDNINITNFLKLKSIIKSNAKGYKPKKAYVLRWEQITKFIKEAPDIIYLSMKVILIFGICGCLRCDEITNIKVTDVADLTDKYMVSINSNKNDYPGQFLIGNLFYSTVKKYISLRPSDEFSNRFFIKYQQGKCHGQPMGRHKIGETPQFIASYLNLLNPERYTGHYFRRTSATLLSNSGANIQMIKQLGRWRSDLIAQGYVENSEHNRQLIFNGITQKATTDTLSKQSTSAMVTNEFEKDESYDDLNWADFSEEFNLKDVSSTVDRNKSVPDGVLKTGFVTGNEKQILIPVTNKINSDAGSSKLFLNKPGIKLNFSNQATVHPPPCKKTKCNEDSVFQNENINSNLTKENLKFENCTFNSCVFHIASSKQNKE